MDLPGDAPSARAARLRAELFGDHLTVDEVAHVLDVDRSTVLRYVRRFELFAYQMGRSWWIPEASLREFVAKLKACRKEQGRP
jgi:excisionase family DNA binding protein